MKASDLRAIASEARPIIERMMDDAELLASMRETATVVGLDWSQVKAILKAQIKDERDGGDGKRVKAIIERADHASAYADMLGLAKMNENNFSAETPQPHIQTEKPVQAAYVGPPEADPFAIPAMLKRERATA